MTYYYYYQCKETLLSSKHGVRASNKPHIQNSTDQFVKILYI